MHVSCQFERKASVQPMGIEVCHQLLSIFKSSMLRLENHSQPLATRDSCNSARPVKLRFHTCPEGFKMKSGDVDHGGILGDPETKQMWGTWGGAGWIVRFVEKQTQKFDRNSFNHPWIIHLHSGIVESRSMKRSCGDCWEQWPGLLRQNLCQLGPRQPLVTQAS